MNNNNLMNEMNDEYDEEWCSPECEMEEGCIKCNPFAFQAAEQLKKWIDEKEKEAAAQL
jgi:hypothetical protein